MGSTTFKLLSGGDIGSINVRKQNLGDDDGSQVLAVDISVSGETDTNLLIDLLGCTPEQAAAFWTHSDANTPCFHGIKKIPCSTEFCDHELKIASKVFPRVKLHKFSVEIIAGLKIKAYFTATIVGLAEHETETLLTHIKTNTKTFNVADRNSLFGSAQASQSGVPASEKEKPAAKKKTTDKKAPAKKAPAKKADAKKKPATKKPADKKAPAKKPAAKKKMAEESPKKGAIDPKTVNSAARGKPTLAAVK